MTHDQVEMVLRMNGFENKGCCNRGNVRPMGQPQTPCFSIHWTRRHPRTGRPQHIYIFETIDANWMTVARRTACKEWINHRNEKVLVSRNLEIPPADFLDAMELCP